MNIFEWILIVIMCISAAFWIVAALDHIVAPDPLDDPAVCIPAPADCLAYQAGDTMRCPCGNVWKAADALAPPCRAML